MNHSGKLMKTHFLYALAIGLMVLLSPPLKAPPLDLVFRSLEGNQAGTYVYLFDSTGEGGLVHSYQTANIGNDTIPQLAELFNPADPSFYLSQAGGLSIGTTERYPAIPFYFILHHPGFGSLSGYAIPGAYYAVPIGTTASNWEVSPHVMVPVSFADLGLRAAQTDGGGDPDVSVISPNIFVGDSSTTAGLIAGSQLLSTQETTVTLHVQYLPGHTLAGESDDTLVRRILISTGPPDNLALRWTSHPTDDPLYGVYEYPPLRPFPVTGPVRITLTVSGYQSSSVRVEQQSGIASLPNFLLIPDESSPTPGLSPGAMPNPGLQLYQFAQKDILLGRAMPAPRLLPGTGDANRDGVIDAADLSPANAP